MTRKANSLICLGCGYVASTLSRRMIASGWQVAGTTRDAVRAEKLTALGISVLDPSAQAISPSLGEGSHLLVSAAPTAEGDPFLRSCESALRARRRSIRWIGYLSSTSVYGDTGGAWVDERSPCNAGFERGNRRIAAEREWRKIGEEVGVPVTVFRLAGIYGPGRNQLAQLRMGHARRILKPGQVFSRIHVDDIASALEAALTSGCPETVFNVADDEPAATGDVVAYAARLLGARPPPPVAMEDASITDRVRAMYSECRRVSNARMKARLLPRLAYPTYREGLRGILDAEGAQPRTA